MLSNLTFQQLVEELASDSPAPGGGSVAALAGSLGAALVCMVANLTIGKEKYADERNAMMDVRTQAGTLIRKLSDYAEKDAEAFNQVMGAYKLPKNTDEEKETRKAAINSTLKNAATLPLVVAQCCLEVLEFAQYVVAKGNTNSLSDAGVAALMAHAGLHGAVLNVEINLKSIQDEEFVRTTNEEKETIVRGAYKIKECVMTALSQALASS